MNKLTFKMLLHNVDQRLDTAINDLLDKGIEKTETSNCYITLYFPDNYEFTFWNVNKWYGWVQEGIIKKDGERIYNWHRVRPTRKTMLRLDNEINKLKIIK